MLCLMELHPFYFTNTSGWNTSSSNIFTYVSNVYKRKVSFKQIWRGGWIKASQVIAPFHITKVNFVEQSKRKEKKVREYEDSKLNKKHFCWSFCVSVLCYLLLYSLIQLLECSEFELHLRKLVI